MLAPGFMNSVYCCVLLWVFGQCCVRLKAHANGRNKCQQLPTLLGAVGEQFCVHLHGPETLTSFKLYATSGNKCQHCCGSMQTDATSHNIVGPNNVGCCWPTMLGPFARTLEFDRFQIIRNECQHCCGPMQTDATCWAQQCCLRLHGP